MGDDLEAFGEFGDAVAMAHPHLIMGADRPEPIEQRRVARDLDIGAAEFALVGGFDAAAELLHQSLLAVADAEHGDAEFEHALRRAGRAFARRRIRTAGKDDRLRRAFS